MSESPHPLHRDEFPRSNAYDSDWVLDCQMGPNALWLVEWLTERMDLKPGMRVLDLGCGKALTSVFLAREFGVQVWAADLWTPPDGNWERIRTAGVEDRVFPLQAEAHALPLAKEFFDAVVSVDAYEYFGTDELYLAYLTRFVRPRGTLGVVVPGLMQPIEGGVPEHLTQPQSNGASFWNDECICFLTADRWRALWQRSNRVDVAVVDTLPDGWKLWRDFEVAVESAGKSHFPSVAETLDNDAGRYLGFVRLVATRRDEASAVNLYEPSLLARFQGNEQELVAGTQSRNRSAE
ncbi:MAG TPA: methyltransferase domain-containing protein [Thermoguttaceae bacterium]|nr:methyltransferase domain-containing protein [Thermoguttaceae bacterium]